MRDRRLSGRPVCIELISIGEVDVQPSVIVIVKKSQSTSLGLNDGAFVVYTAPYIGAGKSGLPSHIDILDRRCACRHIRILPFPKGSGQSLCQPAAEQEER